MNKKIYFAGSIRGGRVDAALYQRIIQYINRTDVVLTEQQNAHVLLSVSVMNWDTPKRITSQYTSSITRT